MEELFLEKLKSLSLSNKLPDYEYLFNLSNTVTETVENEFTEYREKGKNQKAGGLLDFTEKNIPKLPLIVIPDLHARRDFLYNILNYTLPVDFCSDNGKEIDVFTALQKKLIRIVCVGDLLHSEIRGRLRWLNAWKEIEYEDYSGENITEEMIEGLSLLCMAMELKAAFSENFHILKGNHENILNENCNGNYSFRKFANEGEMVKDFLYNKYGEDILYVISCFEKALPLLAAFDNCVISHAEPLKCYNKNELINGLSNEDVILGLTWTENGKANQDSVKKLLSQFVDLKKYPNAKYIGGHRPALGKYNLRQNGLYIQIHNPLSQNIALICNDRTFNPDTDIVNVEKQ